MKHFRERFLQKKRSLRTLRQLVRKAGSMNLETGLKLMQYLMLCVLLYLCFTLPGAGIERSVRESDLQRASQRAETAQGAVAEMVQGAEAAQGTAAETLQGEEAAQERTDSRGIIVIDAGHGGDDPGMTGGSGISEKVLNLIYAMKLKALLEAEGYEIVMTRETEEGLYDADASNKKAQDMQRRVALIAEADPLLAVSIHQNSYPDASISGPQVFYYEHSAEGEKLAASIQETMNTELQIARPRVHKGNTSYYILKRSEAVTVIVECGFLSCPEEEEKLQEETYQDRAVQAICDGILGYLEKRE